MFMIENSKHKKAADSRRGAILAVVLIVTLTVTTLGSGIIALNGVSAVEASKAISAAEAFWVAEGGLSLVESVATKNRVPFDKMSSFSSSFGSGDDGISFNGSSEFTVKIDGRTASVTFPAPAGYDNDTQRIKFYEVTSVGTSAGGVKREVRMLAQIETFASYMHASKWEQTAGGDNIYFGPNDVMDGTVYVNDQLNIYGTPRFLTKVYSAANDVNYQRSSDRTGVDPAVFQAGLKLGAVPLDFEDPDKHLDTLQNAANNGGIALNGSYNVLFNANGTVTYKRIPFGTPVTVDLSTRNGAIYISGKAYVSGKVNGSVTLAARSSIFITNDLTYASATVPDQSDPLFNDDVIDDSLGLIAKDKVEITKRSDINIHGSILVTKGGFGCAGRYESLGNPSINLYGGITQYRRGIVGQVGGRGFTKNYRYDKSLRANPPAQFPYSAYKFSGWKQGGER